MSVSLENLNNSIILVPHALSTKVQWPVVEVLAAKAVGLGGLIIKFVQAVQDGNDTRSNAVAFEVSAYILNNADELGLTQIPLSIENLNNSHKIRSPSIFR